MDSNVSKTGFDVLQLAKLCQAFMSWLAPMQTMDLINEDDAFLCLLKEVRFILLSLP